MSRLLKQEEQDHVGLEIASNSGDSTLTDRALQEREFRRLCEMTGTAHDGIH